MATKFECHDRQVTPINFLSRDALQNRMLPRMWRHVTKGSCLGMREALKKKEAFLLHAGAKWLEENRA